jgi:hypothetical protein
MIGEFYSCLYLHLHADYAHAQWLKAAAVLGEWADRHHSFERIYGIVYPLKIVIIRFIVKLYDYQRVKGFAYSEKV